MDPRTGEFHPLENDEIPEGLVGPFSRGDTVGIGNVVITHQFGLTVRVAQVGDVVPHMGQKFRVMKIENGNLVLRSMVSLPQGTKTTEPHEAAAADAALTKQVMQDGAEFCSEPEEVESATDELKRELDRLQGEQDGGEVDEAPTRLSADQSLVDALCAIDEGLTDWEVKFVEDVATQVQDNGNPLTPKQREKANQILSEKG